MHASARNATSHDIAREAGVSQSTVSRTLRNDPRVAPETAERVLRVAKRLGYFPNASARSLVTRRSRTVAVVVADITNPFYPQLVEALHEQLGRAGYRMILYNERTDVRGDGGLEVSVNSSGADGAVFLSVTIGPEAAELLTSARVPSVLLNRDVSGAAVDRVMADHVGGAAAVAQHLLALGHRRIALIAGPANTSTSRDREAGFTDALARAGVPLDPALRRAGEFTHQIAASRAPRSCSTARTRRRGLLRQRCGRLRRPGRGAAVADRGARTRLGRRLRRHPDGELGRVRAHDRAPAARRHGPRRRADPRRAHRGARRLGAPADRLPDAPRRALDDGRGGRRLTAARPGQPARALERARVCERARPAVLGPPRPGASPRAVAVPAGIHLVSSSISSRERIGLEM